MVTFSANYRVTFFFKKLQCSFRTVSWLAFFFMWNASEKRTPRHSDFPSLIATWEVWWKVSVDVPHPFPTFRSDSCRLKRPLSESDIRIWIIHMRYTAKILRVFTWNFIFLSCIVGDDSSHRFVFYQIWWKVWFSEFH